MLALHYLAGVVAAGGAWDWPVAWLETVDAYQEADFLANGWQAISLPAFGRQLEILHGAAVPRWRPASPSPASSCWHACRPCGACRPRDAVALAAACGLLDQSARLGLRRHAPAARPRRAGRPLHRGGAEPWRERWGIAAAYAIALTWPLTAVLGFTLVPVLVLAAPFALLEVGPFRPRELGRGPA